MAATTVWGCAERRQPVSSSPPSTISAAQRRVAYETGLRLAAQSRAADRAHRAEMAALVDASVTGTRDRDLTLLLKLRVHNLGRKTIRRLDAGLEVARAGTRGRIGLVEISLVRTVAPHATVSYWQPVPYLRFGEDSGFMVLAAGKPKRAKMEVMEITYDDGSVAGDDD